MQRIILKRLKFELKFEIKNTKKQKKEFMKKKINFSNTRANNKFLIVLFYTFDIRE